MEQIKGLIRPPFANYDVVVYFGGGLFALNFIYRYILEPLDLNFPTFRVPMGQPYLSDGVAILTTLFVIYAFGHIIAYFGSQFIEKFVDRVFGKVSTAIFVSSRASSRKRNEYMRALIYNRVKKIRKDGALPATVARAIAHIPAIPIHTGIFAFGIFGYYDTRIPYPVLHLASQKIKEEKCLEERIGVYTKWYKPLEYFVINRCPVAVSRMYNYLVIAGLFRTLTTVFLFSLWMQFYYGLHYISDGDWYLEPFMGYDGPFPGLIEYAITACAFGFSLFSYLKFQRRYAEEAIFAFVFGESGDKVATLNHKLEF